MTSKLPDKDRRAVWRFPVGSDGTLGEGQTFFFLKDLKPKIDGLPPAKDGGDTLVGWIDRIHGLAIDRDENFYIGVAESHTSGSAVAVISPDGKEVLAMILDVPGNIASLALTGDCRCSPPFPRGACAMMGALQEVCRLLMANKLLGANWVQDCPTKLIVSTM